MNTLKRYAEIKTNFPDADFWIVRKGSADKVGTPIKEYSPEHIGVKVTRTDVLLPNYLYYAMEFMKTQGYFKNLATGTLALKNIKVDDVKNMPIGR